MDGPEGLMSWLPEVMAGISAGIRQRGFVTGSIEGDILYTIGLTEVGHPELVIIGPRPAVKFLEEWAESVLAREKTILPPSMFWDEPVSGGQHMLTVVPYGAGLGLVAAMYNNNYTAVRIELNSCPCPMCADTVVVDSDGNYVRDAP